VGGSPAGSGRDDREYRVTATVKVESGRDEWEYRVAATVRVDIGRDEWEYRVTATATGILESVRTRTVDFRHCGRHVVVIVGRVVPRRSSNSPLASVENVDLRT